MDLPWHTRVALCAWPVRSPVHGLEESMRAASIPQPFPGRTLKNLSDDELLRRLAELLQRSRRGESELIAHIGEVDARRLYAREGSPSMFAYCTELLHLSEAEAYLRITVARAARAHPKVLEMLADGRLHLSGVERLAPHLTVGNGDAVLSHAAHKTKRQIEELIATMAPKPDVRALIRRLPAARPGEPATTPLPTAASELRPDGVPAQERVAVPHAAPVQPLAPGRYKVQFTASAAFRDKLERLKALMLGSVPDGDLAAILEQAVTEKLQRLEAKRLGKTDRPRKRIEDTDTSAGPRYIPAAVRRAVYARDQGRCRFVSASGKRCNARDSLELHHHVRPHGRGGDRSPENLRLMCRAHNGHLAEQVYGKEMIARHRGP
jgi:hypothetical protein